MARRTQAQILAERRAEQERINAEREQHRRETYFPQLMQLLERASRLSLPLAVKNGQFVVTVTERGSSYRGDWTLTPEYTETSFDSMVGLTYAVQELEEERAEAERLALLRKTALAKLTKEEREVLGVSQCG